MGLYDDNDIKPGSLHDEPAAFPRVGNPYLENPADAMRLLSALLNTESGQNDIQKEIREFKRLLDYDYLEFASQSLEDLPDEASVHNSLDDIHDKLLAMAECPAISTRRLLAVAGGFSSGKSSFLNSLLSLDELLPVETRPTTAIPTFIVAGKENGISALNRFGCHTSLDKDSFAAISHQFKDAYGLGFTLILRHAMLTLKDAQYTHVAFIDTPGYTKADSRGSAIDDATDERTAMRQASEADAILWLMDIENGVIQETDLVFLEEVVRTYQERIDEDAGGKAKAPSALPIYFVFNKSDKKPPTMVEEVCKNTLSLLKGKPFNVAGLSAYSSHRNAETVFDGSGVKEFILSMDLAAGDRFELEKQIKKLFAKYRSHNERKIKAERQTLGVFNRYLIEAGDADTGSDFDIGALISEKKTLIRDIEKIPALIKEIEGKLVAQLNKALKMIYAAPPPSMTTPKAPKKPAPKPPTPDTQTTSLSKNKTTPPPTAPTPQPTVTMAAQPSTGSRAPLDFWSKGPYIVKADQIIVNSGEWSGAPLPPGMVAIRLAVKGPPKYAQLAVIGNAITVRVKSSEMRTLTFQTVDELKPETGEDRIWRVEFFVAPAKGAFGGWKGSAPDAWTAFKIINPKDTEKRPFITPCVDEWVHYYLTESMQNDFCVKAPSTPGGVVSLQINLI